MTCPNCQIELKCPCKSCQKSRLKQGKVEVMLWEWKDGDTIMCPVCGFYHSADLWQDYEGYLYAIEEGIEMNDPNIGYVTEEVEKWRENERIQKKIY